MTRLHALLAILIALVSSWVGWEWRDRAADAQIVQMERAAAQAAVEANERQAQAIADAVAKVPRSEGKIREVVKTYPAQCDRPVPVANSLQDAIRKANASRGLSADS